MDKPAKTPLEAWHAAYSACMAPKSFDVPLLCPECHKPLVNFSCSTCKVTQIEGKEKAKLAAGGAVATFLSVIYAFIRPLSSVLIKDLSAERQMETSVYAKEVLLAQRYQEKPETYDQAALCYMTWLQKSSFFKCPAGLITFIQQYREATQVNEGLRQTFLDVAFVKGCAVWSEYCQHPSLLAVSSNHSEIQDRAARLITNVEREHRRRGANTTSMRALVSFLSVDSPRGSGK